MVERGGIISSGQAKRSRKRRLFVRAGDGLTFSRVRPPGKPPDGMEPPPFSGGIADRGCVRQRSAGPTARLAALFRLVPVGLTKGVFDDATDYRLRPDQPLKTAVAIIGAGPAGMMLAHLLHMAGIETVVIERSGREHVLGRIRAGILESTTTDLLRRLGLGDRLDREGIIHEGLLIASEEDSFRLDLPDLTGRVVTAYGQTEVSRDLFDGADARGLRIVWNAADVVIHDADGVAPSVHWRDAEGEQQLDCDFIAGCDGFHGASRASIPAGAGATFDRAYPFGWLGILADVPPCHHEVIYSRHSRGFGIASMRSMTRSRYYIQVPLDERIEDWPDDRLWDELAIRLGPEAAANMTRGPALEKSIAPLRSFVFEPMRHGRLFLGGDAAHIVPPIGAKGLNLAASDMIYLGEALIAWYRDGDERALHDYSRRALARIWKTERFSWHLTQLMHIFPDNTPFEDRMHRAELAAMAGSRAMQTALAEHYVGLPI